MKLLNKKLLVLTTLASSLFATNAVADVVTTIRPVAFVIEALTQGVTKTDVLVEGNQSPHDFQLTPSKLQRMKNADLFVYVDNNLETTVGKALTNENNRPKNILVLSELPEVKKMLVKGIHFHPDEKPQPQTTRKLKGDHGQTTHDDKDNDHDHDHDHDHHELEYNYHIWASPKATYESATAIANELTQLFPSSKDKIQANLAEFKSNLDKTVTEVKEIIKPENMNNYYVFHDAYTYFEKDFGFSDKNKGALLFNLNVDPSIKQLNELHERGVKEQVKTIFIEPQFNQGVALKLAKSIDAKLGVLDPLGTEIKLDKMAYFSYLKSLANSFSSATQK